MSPPPPHRSDGQTRVLWPHSRVLSPGARPHLPKPPWPPGVSWSLPGTFLPEPSLFPLPRTPCYLSARFTPSDLESKITTLVRSSLPSSANSKHPSPAHRLQQALPFSFPALFHSTITFWHITEDPSHLLPKAHVRTTGLSLYELTVALIKWLYHSPACTKRVKRAFLAPTFH